MRSDAGVVIVGGGQAGAWAAATLRDEGFDGRVVLVGEEAHIPYERPPLSKAVLSGAQAAESCAVKPADFYGERNIELRLGCRAGALDRERRRLELTDGESLRYEQLVLATGARPRRLALPGSELAGIHYLRTLDDSLALRARLRPDARVVLIGGGYIGLELGSVYAALGSRVSVVEMTSGLLPGVDRDLVRVLSRRLQQRFAAVMLETTVTGLHEEPDGIRVKLEGAGAAESEQVYEKVLVAVGRRPQTDGLGLENTRVALDAQGFVQVDPQRRTHEPSIYAIGDITGEPMLAHKAAHEGRVAAQAVAGKKTAFEPQAIPAVVFTDPEIAWCGLTESQAKQLGRDVTIARFPWAASGRALTLGQSDGVTKLLIDPETQRVLGVGIAGSGAGEMIAEGVLAVEMAALASDLSFSIHPHPTLSESLMEAADVFFGHSTHVYRPSRAR